MNTTRTSAKNTTNKPQKRYNVKPKPIHYRAIKNMVENGGNVSRAMVEAGYSPATAVSPSKLTNSRGFKQAMNELGLTDELLVGALVEDVKDRKTRTVQHLSLGFKLRGHLKDNTQNDNRSLILITSGESATRYQLPTTTHVDEDVKE